MHIPLPILGLFITAFISLIVYIFTRTIKTIDKLTVALDQLSLLFESVKHQNDINTEKNKEIDQKLKEYDKNISEFYKKHQALFDFWETYKTKLMQIVQ